MSTPSRLLVFVIGLVAGSCDLDAPGAADAALRRVRSVEPPSARARRCGRAGPRAHEGGGHPGAIP